jgi:hypothetical protein
MSPCVLQISWGTCLEIFNLLLLQCLSYHEHKDDVSVSTLCSKQCVCGRQHDSKFGSLVKWSKCVLKAC